MQTRVFQIALNYSLLQVCRLHTGDNTEFFFVCVGVGGWGGGGSTKKCDHNCDQAFIKSNWGSV